MNEEPQANQVAPRIRGAVADGKPNHPSPVANGPAGNGLPLHNPEPVPALDGAYVPEPWREAIARQACQPMVMSREFEAVVDPCAVKHAAATAWRWQVPWPPRWTAKVALVLLLLATLLWVGCQAVDAVRTLGKGHASEIERLAK